MARRSVDPSTSLERKLRDFGSSLPPEEKDLFYGILLIAATADDPEVEGFAVKSSGPVGRSAVGFGGGSEVSMIELQSLISTRQTAIQMTTSLMASMNESGHGIVGNIGQ